jgi:phosphotransacetylase
MRESPPDLALEFKRFAEKGPHAGGSKERYKRALRRLESGDVDAVVAGATIALSEFLPIVFSTFGTTRGKTLLFSVAPIEPSHGEPFLLVDPCVVPEPEPSEIVTMAVGAARLFKALYARNNPYVAVISHATGSFQLHKDRKAAAAVEALLDAGQVPCSQAVLQLDAALSTEAASRKAVPMPVRPNVLVCTQLGVANAVYKTLEIFGRSSVELSGAILMGLEQGLIGLLPRTCTTDEVGRLFLNLARVRRGMEAG